MTRKMKESKDLSRAGNCELEVLYYTSEQSREDSSIANVSEGANDYFVRATLTQNLGLVKPNVRPPKFGGLRWRESLSQGSPISHVEALRRGAFLSELDLALGSCQGS